MMDTERYIYSHMQVYCANCECLDSYRRIHFFIFNLQISVLILQFVFYSILFYPICLNASVCFDIILYYVRPIL